MRASIFSVAILLAVYLATSATHAAMQDDVIRPCTSTLRFEVIPRPGVPKNSFRSFTSMIPTTDESSPHITARISFSAAEEGN